jgi:hypothetical protein
MSEWYARDCSRKVKAGYRAKALNGQYTGPYAPYGYMKSPENKYKLIPHPDTAATLKRIFQMAASGLTPLKISTIFKNEKIVRPRMQTMQETNEKYSTITKYPFHWSYKTLITIIQNRVYLGHMVSNKSTSQSFKNRKTVLNAESEWITVENTHEPLVDEHTFEQAQKATIAKRKAWTGEPHIFSGLMICGDCGNSMHYLKRSDRSYSASYSCNTYSKHGKEYCTMHYIRYEDLHDIILRDIRKYAKLAKKHGKEFVEAITKTRCEISEFQKTDALHKEVYDDSKRFCGLLKKYFGIKELTATILNELVNKIVVHEREVFKGKRYQQIDIYYSLVGILDENRSHLLRDRRWRVSM